VTIIATSRLRRMPLWDERERATLVALLLERPEAASWPQVAAEIMEAGSAWSVWDAAHAQSLFDAETPDLITKAARHITDWRLWAGRAQALARWLKREEPPTDAFVSSRLTEDYDPLIAR
jgi:hypothetical protein